MLFLDSELTPFSPTAELQAWRDRLLEMKNRYPEPEDQETIDRELVTVKEYLETSARFHALMRARLDAPRVGSSES